jgi:hypothetical protein
MYGGRAMTIFTLSLAAVTVGAAVARDGERGSP